MWLRCLFCYLIVVYCFACLMFSCCMFELVTVDVCFSLFLTDWFGCLVSGVGYSLYCLICLLFCLRVFGCCLLWLSFVS